MRAEAGGVPLGKGRGRGLEKETRSRKSVIFAFSLSEPAGTYWSAAMGVKAPDSAQKEDGFYRSAGSGW